ncbi:MAG: ABC transporter permease subunit [Frankiales bacterium]|nr:ABC transporter permease subunit [Frankiales bacterium]
MPTDLWGWLTYNDPAAGMPARIVEHLQYTAGGVLLACLVGLPVGLLLGHLGRGGTLAINLSNIGRAIPTLGVVVLFAVSPLGTSLFALSLALGLFALPPVLTNAYVGMREVDPEAVEAARGMGMTPGQIFRWVELPLAFPLVAAGVRSAILQVIATAVLAAAVGGGGLGRFLIEGLGSQDYPQLQAGALVVAALALVVELVLGLLQRLVDPVARSAAAART